MARYPRTWPAAPWGKAARTASPLLFRGPPLAWLLVAAAPATTPCRDGPSACPGPCLGDAVDCTEGALKWILGNVTAVGDGRGFRATPDVEPAAPDALSALPHRRACPTVPPFFDFREAARPSGGGSLDASRKPTFGAGWTRRLARWGRAPIVDLLRPVDPFEVAGGTLPVGLNGDRRSVLTIAELVSGRVALGCVVCFRFWECIWVASWCWAGGVS